MRGRPSAHSTEPEGPGCGRPPAPLRRWGGVTGRASVRRRPRYRPARRRDATGPSTHAPPASSAWVVGTRRGKGPECSAPQRWAAGHAGTGSRPRGTPGPPSPGRRRAPRGPMGAATGRPAPRRRTSVPGHGSRRCRVLELSACHREPTAALNCPCGRAEAPPGRPGAAAAAEEEASAGGPSGRRGRAHGVHLTEELPRPGARPPPGAPRRRPEG